MGGVRIRWRALAKLAALVVGAVAALQVLPALLKAPAPPPLARDVGLPRVKPAPVQTRGSFPTHEVDKEPRDSQARHRAALPPDVISSLPRRHHAPKPKTKRSQRSKAPKTLLVPKPVTAPPPPIESAPPAPVEPPPPPAPAPPTPLPQPPPPPADGSEEFAPH
jgi:hypothetical protein